MSDKPDLEFVDTDILMKYNENITNNNDIFNDIINNLNANKFNSRYFTNANLNIVEQTIDQQMNSPLLFNAEDLQHMKQSKEIMEKRMKYNEKRVENQDSVTYYMMDYTDDIKKSHDNTVKNIDKQYRSVEMNNYYYKKYSAQNKILWFVIKVSLVVIILSFFNSLVRNKIVDTLFLAIVGIIFSYALIHICYQLFDIYMRDKHIFDEYDFEKVNDDSRNYKTENVKSKCKKE